jgi:Uma2 family endonuclease
VTPEEYLAFERASEQKHEYADGEIFARAGGTREHNLIAANALGELSSALLEGPCEVYGSDQKIVTPAAKYHYPDVSVACGPTFEDATRDAMRNPKVVVEVLSDSTERDDRGDKFASYRAIPSFVEYVLVSQTAALVEHYRRLPDGTWLYRTLGPGEVLALPSLGCEIPVDRLYLKVFPAP